MFYRFGMRDESVKLLQIALNIEADGIYGRMTEAAVKNFQLKNSLPPTGVADPETLALLIKPEVTSDVSERVITASENLVVEKYHLPASEYRSDNPTPDKKFIFIHHTAGSHNPYNVIDGWDKDTRGRVATQYVIGGRDLKDGDEHDGVILEAFPSPFWAGHLGNVSSYLQSHSIGIEICNWGILTEKNGRFYTYTGRPVPASQVVTLKEPFRGSKYYHNYSDEQLKQLKSLLIYLSKEHNIDITKGLQNWINTLTRPALAFEYYTDAAAGKVYGLLSHSNVRKDKSDVYPHPKLISLIKDLPYEKK